MTRKNIILLVRNLRKNQTPAETKLWEVLRNRKLIGKKFLRQHPIIYEVHYNKLLFFIADFYCAEHSLVVELDGKIHDYQKDYDEQRDIILRNCNLSVVRFKNEELHDLNKVLEKIKIFCR